MGKQKIYLANHLFPGGNRAWLTSSGGEKKKITFRKIKTFHINKDGAISKVLGRYTDIFAD